MKKSSKNRLTPSQEKLFQSDSLFDKIARTVCRAGTLPRKELFEAWEMAKRVRRHYRGGRVLDMACGHGLLAHILLILDDTSERAVAVDRVIPENALRLSRMMTDAWPRLTGRIEFWQMDIADIKVSPGDLVVSAHACGVLTDLVIKKATQKKARLAVLPCCHNAKLSNMAGLNAWMDKSLAIDAVRAFKLQTAGYKIITANIPDAITPKNRLLMGEVA